MERSSQRTLDSISLQLASLQGADTRRFLGSAMSMVDREAKENSLFIGENALHPAKHLLAEVKQVEVKCHLMHADFCRASFYTLTAGTHGRPTCRVKQIKVKQKAIEAGSKC